MHLGGRCYNRVELLTSKGAEKSTVASAADCEVEADRLTAGHERKHNACRAESEARVKLQIAPKKCNTRIDFDKSVEVEYLMWKLNNNRTGHDILNTV